MSRHRALSWRGLVPRFQRSFVGLGLTTRWTRNFVPTSKIVPMTRRKTDLRLVGWGHGRPEGHRHKHVFARHVPLTPKGGVA
jgi:hypothetical protein